MSISNALCKLVESSFNYSESEWSYEHVTTTLEEVLHDSVLSQTLDPHKEVESFTYYSLGMDDITVYPFVIKDEHSIIAIGYIDNARMKLLYLNDGSNTIIDKLDLLNLKKEVISIGNLG